MKLVYTMLMALLCYNAQAQIISEIMYNPPESGADSLEYIELYNNTGADINLDGYSIQGIFHTFSAQIFAADSYLVIAKDSAAFVNVFGGPVFEWEEGALNNGGEELAIYLPDSTKISVLTYSNDAGWPEEANGLGYALENCLLAGDPSDASNWGISTTGSGVIIENREIFGSPNRPNNPDCSAGEIEYLDVTINEIMYSPTGDQDSLEYIELYNFGTDTVNLQGWTMDGDITFNLPGLSLLPRGYLVISKNPDAIANVFGIPSFPWAGDQTLGDSAGELILFNDQGSRVNEVQYSNMAPWPEVQAGEAITYCSIGGDNNEGVSWTVASKTTEDPNNGSLLGSPGSANRCGDLSIADITEQDSVGRLLLLDQTVTTSGVVYGFNTRPGGLQFTIIDDENNGIGVFLLDMDLGYTVVEGDRLEITGAVAQFNGFAQIVPTEISFLNAGNLLFEPTIITSLDESTESQLVTFENATLVDSTEWTSMGSGFNVRVTNGTDTLTARIDLDVSAFGLNFPTGTFSITGLGGQFDNSEPYDSGYQFLPRYDLDIDPFIEFDDGGNTGGGDDLYPVRMIEEVTRVNVDGVTDSLDVMCTLTGLVYGVNLSSTDLIMTIIDGTNEGIGVFNNDNIFDYQVTEGDEVELKGTISQFNGLTQIIVDSLTVLSVNNDLVLPREVSQLDETTESSLIITPPLEIIDVSQWNGMGGSFNVEATDGTNIFVIRIDDQTELSSTNILSSNVIITGIGGQFDNSDPYTEGYQILPRFIPDVETYLSVIDTDFDEKISVSPNPVEDYLMVSSSEQISLVNIYNSEGKRLSSNVFTADLDMRNLESGLYFIQFVDGERISMKKVIKI